MESGNWRGEAWPGPERARQRLPRVEDLPGADNGYDRERVREAFDAFYRHIAQLDSTLRALEAVEVFRDQAGELRRELRALKAAGWTQQPWPSYGRERVSAGIPEALPRFAIEAAFLIVVAVVVAVAGFDRLSIVLVMALAWAIVGVVEWAASRERFARARVPASPRAATGPPQPAPLRIVPPAEPAADSWAAPVAASTSGAEEDEDERTVIRPVEGEAAEVEAPAAEAVSEPAAAAEAAPALDPGELEPAAAERAVEELEPVEPERAVDELEPAAAAEPAEPAEEPEPEQNLEPELQPVGEDASEPASRWSWAADTAVERARERALAENPPVPRRRFWQRRKRDADGMRFDSVQPRHVRVLPPEPSFDERFPVEPVNGDDPWERDLDISIEEPEGPVDGEQPAEREAALDRRDL